MSLHHPAQLELFLFDNGMPEGGTSLATQTPWGKTLQTISVTDKDDAALLWVASSDKPWRLVAYTDEVTTGHPLHAPAEVLI